MRILLSLLLVAVLAASQQVVVNEIYVKEEEGVSTANYPMQIGRVFMKGEIPNFPQVVVGNTPVFTQADVKTRWDDGSVYHAVLSFFIPYLGAHQNLTLRFQNQPTGNNVGFLDKAAILAFPDLNAQIDITSGGVTKSANLRQMIQANAGFLWLVGPVATSIVIADHSVNRTFDIGFDNHRSFRPIFHVTMYPYIGKARVRFIGENANTETLQLMVFNLTLRLGANLNVVYSQANVRQTIATRWTKEFWIGGEPSAISVNHNLGYLIHTKIFPHYDVSKQISENTIANLYADFLSKPTELYGAGKWLKFMGSTGGRDDIGHLPGWTVLWLYTGDYRLKQVAFTQCDLAAAWPAHYREGRADKYFDYADTIPGIGRIVSIKNRPSLRLSDLGYKYTATDDKITPVGSTVNDGWQIDDAHQPDIGSAQYILSGDFWYLEQLYFWAGWGVGQENWDYRGPKTNYWDPVKGPPAGLGHLAARAEAWIMRTRALTAVLAPDSHPEKQYFLSAVEDALEIWAGKHNITERFNGEVNWVWGLNDMLSEGPKKVSPLSMWKTGDPETAADGGFIPGMVKKAESPWMNNFLILEVGRTLELGFEKTEGILKFLCQYLNGMLTDPGYNPYLVQEYRIPTVKDNSAVPEQWFETWAEVKACYPLQVQNAANWDTFDGPEHDYRYIALAATSQCADYPNGAAAWSFMSSLLDHWAITPRVGSVTVATSSWTSSTSTWTSSTFPTDTEPTKTDTEEAAESAGNASKLSAIAAILALIIALM